MEAIIRLSPEIGLKSRQVYKRFTKRLVSNIHAAFGSYERKIAIKVEWNRLFVRYDDVSDLKILQRIYGITTISPVEHECAPTIEAMSEICKENYTETVVGKSFAIRCKRHTLVKDLTSKLIEEQLGAVLYPFAKKVDLTNPEALIEVEVRQDKAYFFRQRFAGPGGLPLGVEGRALSLISGGFDSPVASYLVMKRGVECDFVFFNLAGKAYERSTLVVTKALVENWAYGYQPKIYVVDFDDIVENIKTKIDPKYRQIVLKRVMVRVASLIAEGTDLEMLVTGEVIGQVSSQTLTNLAVIDEASRLSVMRPLVSFDKEEIIKLSRQIGTYAASSNIQEYCELVKKYPVTKAELDRVIKVEENLDLDLLTPEGLKVKKIDLHQLKIEELVGEYVYTETLLPGAVVIDCRTKEEYQSWHQPGSEHLDLEYLLRIYGKLDKMKKYVLLCTYGLQTALVAEKMQSLGFEAYSFRGGTRKLMALAKSKGASRSEV